MKKYQAFIITTLTSTHLGSGETHIGVIDNLVQKDPVTKIPVFHSSGIKGALKWHFKNHPSLNINVIFGKEDDQPGHLIINEATLITLPLRSTHKVYFECSSPLVLEEYFESLNNFLSISKDISTFINYLRTQTSDFQMFDECQNIEIEDYCNSSKIDFGSTGELNEVKKLLKDYCHIDLSRFAIFKDEIFQDICEHNLPIIARNQINEDGTSGNLFYEEVLPRRTKMSLILGDDGTLNSDFSSFCDEIVKTTEIIQFGANYSVGYGFTKISKM
ncbi:MAG: type III-B CRISPR module RAMP protein Cmr4 [Bacteroidota bacterium]